MHEAGFVFPILILTCIKYAGAIAKERAARKDARNEKLKRVFGFRRKGNGADPGGQKGNGDNARKDGVIR